jgi:transcription-repair coupling factor (superfamily II helicase)
VFQGLDAFRPVVDRAPEPQVAEAQRREFFVQLHRWSRQDYDVHVFCNNDGERQRFTEIWREYGFDDGPRAPNAAGSNAVPNALSSALKPEISTHLGSLTRGFIYEEGKLVVVTDAEIFGRYKVQRPRRLKSPHAQTTRSILDIDFAELEEGDYVVHLQHGIGRYLGYKFCLLGGSKGHFVLLPRRSPARNVWSSSMRRVIPNIRRPNSMCLCAKPTWSASTSAPAKRVRR